jgi:hypothetical protein
LVDVDGVISLFGFEPAARPPGAFTSVDGVAHYLSGAAGPALRTLAERFELVWCTGWEEKANDYLPAALSLAGPLPYLSFDHAVGRANTHWKLDAIDAYADARPLAWIDDCLDEACHAWAAARGAPTLLEQTDAAIGIDAGHVARLARWAEFLHPSR